MGGKAIEKTMLRVLRSSRFSHSLGRTLPELWISSPSPPDSWRSLRRATYPQLLHHPVGHERRRQYRSTNDVGVARGKGTYRVYGKSLRRSFESRCYCESVGPSKRSTSQIVPCALSTGWRSLWLRPAVYGNPWRARHTWADSAAPDHTLKNLRHASQKSS